MQTIAEAVPGGEGGLLGIAVSPAYDTDQTVFVYYTAEDDNRVAKLDLGGAADPDPHRHPEVRRSTTAAGSPSARTASSTSPPATRRAGARAQDLNSLGGKILRITPDGKPAPGNPFGTSPVWTATGTATCRASPGTPNKRLYAAEFGQNTWDEINLIEPGKNYGWPTVEGKGGDTKFVDPIAGVEDVRGVLLRPGRVDGLLVTVVPQGRPAVRDAAHRPGRHLSARRARC